MHGRKHARNTGRCLSCRPFSMPRQPCEFWLQFSWKAFDGLLFLFLKMNLRRKHHPSETSPGGYRASHQVLEDYLHKRITVRQLCSRTAKQIGDESLALGCFVTSDDVEYEREYRSKWQMLLRGRSLYFFVKPWVCPLTPCLHWHRSFSGTESLTPVWMPEYVPRVEVRISAVQPWLECLCRLQERPVRRLFELLGRLSEERGIGVQDELGSRKSLFGKCLNAFYFLDEEDSVAWDVASKWNFWEKAGISQTARREELTKVWKTTFNAAEFRSLSPEFQIKRLMRRDTISLEPPFAQSVRKRCVEVLQEYEQKRMLIMTTDIDGNPSPIPSLPFSKGGEFFECLGTPIPKRVCGFPGSLFIRSERAASELLWWWRGVPHWTVEERHTFADNWERNAFLYELRARLLPEYTWDIFDRPWSQLDVTQRALLYYLWPPEREGKYWRRGKLSMDSPEGWKFLNSSVPVSIAESLQSSLRKVEGSSRFWRHELYGIRDLRKPRKKPVTEKIQEPNWKWSLLEALDQVHFGKGSLTNAEQKAKRRAMALHSSACTEVGFSETVRVS